MTEKSSFQTPPIPRGRGPYAIGLLEPKSTDKILNIGCFDGALEYHFLKGKVSEIWGVDVNGDAVKTAQKLHDAERFKTIQSETLPFPDHYFDKILCLDTFEHVQDESLVAREIERVLKPNGTLILSVPHDFLNFLDVDELTRWPRNLYRKLSGRPILNHGKHRHYNLDNLKSFFPNFEFEVIHKSGTPIFWFLTLAYTGVGLPERLVNPLSTLTGPLENWDYSLKLPTGFNIMVRARLKPKDSSTKELQS